MKLDKELLITKLQAITGVVKRYGTFTLVIVFLATYGFLIVRINNLVESEPPAALVNEQLETVDRLQIDQEAIDKITELEDQNIEVRSLFRQARDNPFTE